MSLLTGFTVTVDTVEYSLVSRNAFNEGNTFGVVYIDPDKPGIQPTVTTKYDLSKKNSQRKLVQVKGIYVDPITGDNKPITVNFTVNADQVVPDSAIENVVNFAKACYAHTNFTENVVDGIA
jgi:uncharacterized membrane protein